MKLPQSLLLACVLVCAAAALVQAQNVGLNNDGSPAHPSAILDMKATDKGVLVPRMTAVQRAAIASPATGLLVYQTDTPAGFQFYNGSAWMPIGGAGASGWALAGNAATATDFLGTTTNQPLNFRANNLDHARLTQRGGLELGMNTFGNLFIGENAGAATDLANANVQNFPNTFIGSGAGQANTMGAANHFMGYLAGRFNTTGNNNHFVGYQAGAANTEGNNNHFVGLEAGRSNTTGNNNHFVGFVAGAANTTGSNNHFVGYQAGLRNTTGSLNHFVGYVAGATNTTGSNNHFVGYVAGQFNTTGNNNLFVGFLAGRANTTGSNNHFVGYAAGRANQTGSNNTFMGYEAGQTNQTGSGNVFLGYQAGSTLANPSNQLVIANNPTTPLITGNFANGEVFNQLNSTTWNTTSDRRIKQDIRPLEGALATLLRVRPVRYEFTPEWVKAHPGVGGRAYVGVIAQEYRQVFPDDVRPTTDLLPGDPDPVLSVDMGSAQVVAIRAIQELAAEVEASKQKIQALEKENTGLKTELGEAKKMKGEMEEVKAKQAQTEAKLNEVLKLLQATAPGGGR
jgi:hypothetical protein